MGMEQGLVYDDHNLEQGLRGLRDTREIEIESQRARAAEITDLLS